WTETCARRLRTTFSGSATSTPQAFRDATSSTTRRKSTTGSWRKRLRTLDLAALSRTSTGRLLAEIPWKAWVRRSTSWTSRSADRAALLEVKSTERTSVGGGSRTGVSHGRRQLRPELVVHAVVGRRVSRVIGLIDHSRDSVFSRTRRTG